jgi:uncharacterized protein YqgV (UPF0045/DUF77 family)
VYCDRVDDMNVQAEISLYPLRIDRISEQINTFCDALAKNGLRVETGNMSTCISGDLNQVFDGLKTAAEGVGPECEFVLIVKVSNACPFASGAGIEGLPSL